MNFTKRIPLCLLLAGSTLAIPFGELLCSEPLNLGTRRELFVDHFLIQQLDGVELRLHPPRRAGVALKLDQPWEGIISGVPTVLFDEGQYRMYYRGWSQRRDGSVHGVDAVTCYAESDDGIHWSRPMLRLHEVFGTRENNVVLARTDPITVTHNFCPFVDRRPGVLAAERYKGLGGTSGGLYAYTSPDGVRWKKAQAAPIITKGAFDSINVPFWSQAEQRYICLFRVFKNGVRWISRTTSSDFIHWDDPVEMSFGDAPAEHLYLNQTRPYFRAPHIYIGTCMRFFPGRWALTPEQEREIDLSNPLNYGAGRYLKGGLTDVVLLTSRGGARYDRTFLESFVRAGADLRDWVARSNSGGLGIVPTGDREISFYICRHYGQPTLYIERMALRSDGFSSVHASYAGGQMITRPFRFSGMHLTLNFATSAAGGIRVEFQDLEGKPLPGYTLDECPEIIGDDIERVVAWKGGDNLSALADRALRLRFQMKDADLFSIRFQ